MSLKKYMVLDVYKYTETFENPVWPAAEHLKIFLPFWWKERFILVYSQFDELARFANK